VLYNARDSGVYLIPTAEILAIAAGVGAAIALQAAPAALRWLGALALATSVGWQVWAGWSTSDASHEHEARAWGEAALSTAPPNAVLRSNQDDQTFVLWYLQSAEGLRSDVAIVDDRLLAQPWYRQQLVQHYPQLPRELIGDPSEGATVSGNILIDTRGSR
jgi:hypothetical protein